MITNVKVRSYSEDLTHLLKAARFAAVNHQKDVHVCSASLNRESGTFTCGTSTDDWTDEDNEIIAFVSSTADNRICQNCATIANAEIAEGTSILNLNIDMLVQRMPTPTSNDLSFTAGFSILTFNPQGLAEINTENSTLTISDAEGNSYRQRIIGIEPTGRIAYNEPVDNT